MNPGEPPKSPEAADGGVKEHSAPYAQTEAFGVRAVEDGWAVFVAGDGMLIDLVAYRSKVRALRSLVECIRERWPEALESAKSVPHASVSGETQTADPQDSQKS